MGPECLFVGYDIAPEAIQLSRRRQTERLQCRLADVTEERDEEFDVLLLLDVLEIRRLFQVPARCQATRALQADSYRAGICPRNRSHEGTC